MEAEAMLVGPWKSFEELEESVNLDELNLIVKAVYEKERRHNKFAAAIKGIKIDEPTEDDVETRFERAQFRAQARLNGMSEEDIEHAEEKEVLSGMGFTVLKA